MTNQVTGPLVPRGVREDAPYGYGVAGSVPVTTAGMR